MDRRDFLKSSAAIAASVAAQGVAQAAPRRDAAADLGNKAEAGALIGSAPLLENYAENSMGVAFAVNDMANGYVIYGKQPDLSDGVKVWCGGYRVTDMNDSVMLVRLTGLESATKYYYRIGADRISYKGAYKMKITGNEEDPTIHSFTTAGKGSAAHFAVINDTHTHWDVVDAATKKIAEIAPSCVIWNGDVASTQETVEIQKETFFTPQIDLKDYGADIPYLYCPGNHDHRGAAARHLEKAWMYRQNEERSSRDWDLGRNFAVRMGEVAMIGLDTAEDKLDTNPIFANLFNSGAYREAQTEWLRNALQRKEIKSAPYLVAFCHIPLFDPRPDANPGDIAPDDANPRYRNAYAAWQRTCANMWGPLLSKAGCQLLITGHQHKFRYDEPAGDRRWAQIVGGGPSLESAKGFATVIEGKVSDGRLEVSVHNLKTGEIQQTFSYRPRR